MFSTTTSHSFRRGTTDWLRLAGLLFFLLNTATSLWAQNGAVSVTRSFTYTGSIETFTVPTGITSLTIEARGAEGGDVSNRVAPAGKGAIVAALVNVTPGQNLSILAGQRLNGRAGGGGGSFVVGPPSSAATPTPLVIAGGGSGASLGSVDRITKHGQLGTSGGVGYSNLAGDIPGGINGLGGEATATSGGGGGFLGNGANGGVSSSGGRSFLNGGSGGTGTSNGGFGGGGGTDSGGTVVGSSGGGGGYSGGGGGSRGVGGGGGSFNAGTLLFSRNGATQGNSGSGVVIISYTVYPIRYVKQDATGKGTSWDDASGDLQSQIDAPGVQQVWVATGRYTTTQNNGSFVMKNGVAIYGGFIGNESDFTQRPAVNPVSGSPSTSTLTSTTLTTQSVVNNRNNGLDNSAVLDGVVITGGQVASVGGGVSLINSYPTLSNCLITSNEAINDGGGLFIMGSGTANLLNCLISSNNARQRSGGGLTIINSTPRLSNCVIENNTSQGVLGGGGIENEGNGNPTLINCIIRANSSRGLGGGITNYDNGKLILINCQLSSNSTLTGGGMYSSRNSSATLINCTLTANRATNSTNSGAALFNDSNSQVALTNTILWDNQEAANQSVVNQDANSKVTANYCLIGAGEGDVTGVNNLTAIGSPFVGPGNYQLSPCSVAINAGNNADNTATTDLAGNTRVFGGTIDIGAYEYQGNSAPPVAITQQPPSASSVTAGSPVIVPVNVTGSATAYQWHKNNLNTPVSGQTSATLSIPSATTADAGSYSLVVTGSCNSVTSTAFSLSVVNPPATITDFAASPTPACVGSRLFISATIGNVSGGYSYTLTETISTGTYSGTATDNGSRVFAGIDYDAPSSRNFVLRVVSNGQETTSGNLPVTINPPPVATLTNDGPITCIKPTVTLTASGGSSYTFTSSSGTIGTPGSASTVQVNTPDTYTVTVANSSGCVSSTTTSVGSTTATISVSNPAVTTAIQGVAFNQQFTASGGQMPYSFSVASGTLPSGLALATSGVLSGTPIQSGRFPITVRATDANGCSGASTTYNLVVNQAVMITGTKTVSGSFVPGGTVTYTIVLSNTSSSSQNDNPGNELTDVLPASLLLVSASSSAGTAVAITGTNTVTWNGSIAANGSVTITITATIRAGSATQTVSNQASIRYDTDGNGTNDSSALTDDPNTAAVGDPTNFVVSCPTITASLTNDGPLSCTKATVNLVASGGSTYQFSAGASQVGGASSGTATVNQAGVYSVTAVDSNGCSGTASTTVGQDNTMPMVSISANPSQTIAQGQSATLTASGATSYVWSTGASTTAIVVSTAGPYSVTGTTGSCQGVASMTVIPAVPSGPLAISAVTTNDCQQIAANRYVISFTPQYTGSNGGPISFSVVNEIFPTTAPGPYTLQLYTDNPVIVLKAQQTGNAGEASFTYNWLAACGTAQPNTAPRVNQPIPNQTAKVGEAFGYRIPQLTFTDNETPQSLTLSVQGLPAGLTFSQPNQIGGIPTTAGASSVSVTATDPGGLAVTTTFQLTVVQPASGNTPPTAANPVANQTATQNQPFSLNVGSVFTDAQTPNSLSLTSSPLPAGLALANGVISGTPTQPGATTVTLTATDPGGLNASTTFSLVVQTAPGGGTFAIASVTTNNCQQIAANRYAISFTPVYSGTTGAPISFSVVNELFPTTNVGPYSLQLYNDNPSIVLKASQSGTPGETSYRYDWLAACSSPAPNTPPRVNQPLTNQVARVGQAFGYTIPQLTFTDNETPTTLSLSVSGLPAGLSFSPPAQIGGVPSVTGISTVTVTATDPQGLSVSTTFLLMVLPANAPVGFALSGVQTLSCVVIGANRRQLTFQPQYSGSSGAPVSFSVVNELLPTTDPGPYTLQLYTDNQTLRLRAQQGGTQTSYDYNWLADCASQARQGVAEAGTGLQVKVLGNPLTGSSVEVEISGVAGQAVTAELLNLQGHRLACQQIERATDRERVSLSVDRLAGVLLLEVRTAQQRQILRLVQK
ncbi:hypothetical protein GCM10027592_03720 [Spirosoma flavus]